ncbi:MAG TPA: hypothetical protein VJQ44_00825 [Gemmatimonadales bacterium]|nr:hypothetical protein [Gemmatimonadales bacterium]
MRAARIVAAISLGMLLPACGGDGPAAPAGAAEIEVANRTSGDPLQIEGYVVRLDDEEHGLAVGESIALSGLEPGDHRLELAGITSGCTVSGANPRVIHTRAAEKTKTIFLVSCAAPGTGRVFVQTSTYGDAGGDYLVEVAGQPGRPIGTKDTLTIRAIPAGPVTLSLTGLGRCVVAGRNPRTLVVPLGLTVGSIFKVRCDLPPSPEPQLHVQRADPLPRRP